MKLKRKTFLLVFTILFLFGLNFSKSLAADMDNMKNVNRETLKDAVNNNLSAQVFSSPRESSAYLKVNVDTVSDEHNFNNIASRRISDKTGDFYQWNIAESPDHKVVQGINVWKIRRYKDSTYSSLLNDTIYCLQRDIGFASSDNDSMTDPEKNRQEYKSAYDMVQDASELKSTFNNLKISQNSEIYSKVLWMLEHAYIKTGNSDYKNSPEYINLMEQAGIEIENEDWDLTEDDVDVVQQMAIWRLTNYSSDADYASLPSLYISGIQLTSLYYETDEYGQQITGSKRQAKAEKLYRYLVEKSPSIYSPIASPSLTLSKDPSIAIEKSDGNFIIGPYELQGSNKDLITTITGMLVSKNGSVDYTLLDSNKKVVNDLKKVIGSKFYLQIRKEAFSEASLDLNFKIDYKYNGRTVTFWSDIEKKDTTQPVAIVEDEEKDKTTDIGIKLIKITVKKVWDDNSNQDGFRPKEIKVRLFKNGTKVEDITLPENLEYTWYLITQDTDEYTVAELKKNNDPVGNNENFDENYKAIYTKEASTNTIIITNKHVPEKVNKTVNKSWDDVNNQDGRRPSQVTVELLKKIDDIVQSTNKTAVLNEENGWKYTFEDLDKYENGKEIEYIVKEEIPDGYTTKEQEKSFKTVDEVTIVNSYTPGTVNKTVNKIWVDEDNIDGSRPDSVTVQLFKNDVAEGNPVELNKENNWTYTWIGLPEKQAGNQIIYTVKEIKVGNTNVEQDNKAGEYTVSYSSESFKDTNTITITNTHIPEKTNKIVKKIWEDSNNDDGVRPTSLKVQLYKDNEKFGDPITLDESNNWTYEWKDLQKQKDKKEITYIVKELNEENEPIDNGGSYDANYTATYSDDTFTITNTYKPLDLALRKFITEVDGKELKDSNGELLREPKAEINASTINYKHRKDPVNVEVGNTVTYVIRVYNEGEQNAYVSKIVDNLPSYLEFMQDDKINKDYLWEYEDSTERKISTTITSKDSASGETLYSSRSNKQLISGYKENNLDYIDVKVKCKVIDTVPTNSILTNIAEIAGIQTETGKQITKDRDSIVYNVKDKVDLSTDLKNYKGNVSNKDDLTDNDFYYRGQEDDDDFEKVVVKKFDLSLKKFISMHNTTKIENREPQVDTSKLGTIDESTGKEITNATYKLNKTPISVKSNDTITYTIRVYNEGSVAGFANEITENIPEGLEFIVDNEINKEYKWKMLDKDQKETTSVKDAVFLTTDYLSDKEISEVNELDGVKELSFKDVQIQFKVTLSPKKFEDNIIKNVAQISSESNNDVDSKPSRTDEYNYNGANEDDIDYEPIQVVYFNLALKKFVTKVDETQYNNRYPEIIFNEDGSINYKHTKDPVDVITGATVVYTIRIYNEGTLAGFAEEITDNLPEGLEFLPDNEINKEYKWKMLDKDGEVTTSVINAQKVTTDYLSSKDPSNIIDAMQNKDGQKVISFKDIKIAFKVTEAELVDKLMINIATITKTSEIDIDHNDDSDREYVKIQNFDLSLKKWVTKTIVTYNGKTTTKETGFTENSTEMAKVDIVAKQATKTTVKFVYKIKVTNEGKIAGYATEVKDYIPKGLEFDESDNKDWKLDKDGNAVTDALAKTLLQPGESATVEITLRWKKSTSNTGVKTNYAEISEDSGDDIDSTPNNFDLKEDDIDNADVIISIKTGKAKTYILLATVLIVILGAGTYCIKKYVID